MQFFPGGKLKLDDVFHVANMTPVSHFSMGGVEIDDMSRVINNDGKVIVSRILLTSLCAPSLRG